jgi:hypothetical protein
MMEEAVRWARAGSAMLEVVHAAEAWEAARRLALSKSRRRLSVRARNIRDYGEASDRLVGAIERLQAIRDEEPVMEEEGHPDEPSA